MMLLGLKRFTKYRPFNSKEKNCGEIDCGGEILFLTQFHLSIKKAESFELSAFNFSV
jgi:hypothetical protein